MQGIWGGMIGGICLQTVILIGIVSTRNWEKEVCLFIYNGDKSIMMKCVEEFDSNFSTCVIYRPMRQRAVSRNGVEIMPTNTDDAVFFFRFSIFKKYLENFGIFCYDWDLIIKFWISKVSFYIILVGVY